MQVVSACTHLVRYMEDNRDNFRSKPKAVSWTKFLLEDMYARHMINQIVAAASELRPAVEAGERFEFEIENRDSNTQYPADAHQVSIERVDPERRNARGIGSLALRVNLHRKYTASVFLQF